MVETNVRVFVACSAVLFAKFLTVVSIQGMKSFRSGGRPPEDDGLKVTKIKQTYGLNADVKDERILKAREIEHRWRRIIANDLEQIPLTLIIFAGGILANSNTTVHSAALVVFTVARCLHSYVYANSMQPHRAIFWFIGVLASVVGTGNAVAAIL
jgi:glutathione S-transferase